MHIIIALTLVTAQSVRVCKGCVIRVRVRVRVRVSGYAKGV